MMYDNHLYTIKEEITSIEYALDNITKLNEEDEEFDLEDKINELTNHLECLKKYVENLEDALSVLIINDENGFANKLDMNYRGESLRKILNITDDGEWFKVKHKIIEFITEQ